MRRFCSCALLLTCWFLLTSVSHAKHENWVEVRSPNFIVVSNAGEKQARKAAVQFEQIRVAFRQTIAMAAGHPTPVVTILAVKDEGSMRELLPEYWAKGHSHPAGLFASRINQFYAAVRLDAPDIDPRLSRYINPYETFYHEYYHAISLPYVPGLPLWLAEGLAEFFGHTDIQEKLITTGNTDPLLLLELQNTSWIPLSTLFEVDRNSPYYNEGNKTSIFYAESWVLTHYLMLGNKGAHRPTFVAYLEALNRGKTSSEAAAIAFGDLKKLQNDLEIYVHSGSYDRLAHPAAPFNEEQLQFRVLSEAEADAYRGGFEVVRGQYEDAAPLLDEAQHLDPNVALTYQYLALSQFFTGQRDKALDSSSKAIVLDPKNFFTRYLRAYLETNGSGMGNNSQSEEDLRQAIALSPDFAPPYGLLAVYLAANNRSLDEALTFAKKAISFEPANSNFQLALAQVLVRQKKLKEADLAVARASAWAKDPAEKANAENFKNFLENFRQLQSEASAAGEAEPQILGPANESAGSETDGPVLKRSSGTEASPSAGGFSQRMLQVQSQVTVMGSVSGVDLNPYLKDLMEAVRSKLMPSILKLQVPDPRNVTLELAIAKDGSLVAMKIAKSSGDEALDQATRDGVAAAAPLPSLPGAFKSQSLKLRLQFSYSEQQN
jgi:TonB family protein